MDDKIYLFQQQQTRSTPMNSARQILLRGMLAATVMAVAPSAWTQQINGTPGSPDATVTIDGKQIPPPPMPFGGVIKEAATDSKPYWPPRVVPPKGAPNILLIMTDDQGYGVSGTFGGVIPTPALDRVAKAGLRYIQFHSTALCSPTRAALITGRNHHSMGFGVISELSTGYPGYDSVMSPEKASIGTILRDNGYATSWFGKNHNTPAFQLSASGPFDQWPSGMGFEYFYGFMGGETDQWTPFLFRDHTQIFPWIGRKDYNLTTDLADEAIKHVRDLNAAAPDQPFFVYYVPGGTHSPHQPKPEWVAKFKGKFDMGYEKLRDVIFANQKRLGVIPETTQLTPLPPQLPKWDSLSLLHKKLYAREAEVFAGYAAYTDNEIGRVIQAVEDMGKLDNTLIIYICRDNGIKQKPIEGVSMAYTFDQANAKAPSTRDTQYFEMAGNRGIYHDGWMANTTPFAPPWDLATGKLPDVVNGYKWELYNLNEDFSQFNNLADKMPDKLKEMQALFLTEAAKYQVLPLDNTAFSRLQTPRPSAIAGRTVFTYAGENSGIPLGNAPDILDKDYTIAAEITVPKGGAEGMIVTLGGRFGRFGLYLLKGKPVFAYNLLDTERFRWEGGLGLARDIFGKALAPGKHTLVFDFKYDGPGPGKGGTGVFTVDGKEMAKKTIAHTIPLLMSIDETFDIGLDTGTGVDESYKLPFKFTGTIDKLTVKLGPSQMSAADKKAAEEAYAKVNN